MTSTIIDIDFLFTRMKRDIISFYKNSASPGSKTKIPLHIETLRVGYDPKDFEGACSKCVRRKKIGLLTEIQSVVDIIDEWGFH